MGPGQPVGLALAVERFLLLRERLGIHFHLGPDVHRRLPDRVGPVAGHDEVPAVDHAVADLSAPRVEDALDDVLAFGRRRKPVVLLPVRADEIDALDDRIRLAVHELGQFAVGGESESDVVVGADDVVEPREAEGEGPALGQGFVGQIRIGRAMGPMGVEVRRILGARRHAGRRLVFDAERLGHGLRHIGVRIDQDDAVDPGGEDVPERDAHQEDRHDHRLHRARRLGVGELETGDRDHDLGRGEKGVGEDLPADARTGTGVDRLLHEGDHREADDHDEEPDRDLADRRQGEDRVDRRIDHEGEERDEDQDHDRVDRLDLRRQPRDPEPPPVEVHGLQHPARSGLVEEGPEHRHEDEDHAELQDRRQSLPAEGLSKPGETACGDMDELPTPAPEEERRDAHEDAGNAEGEMRAVPLEEPRRHQGRQERPDVDREVEPPEDLAQEMPVRLSELIAHVGRDARLDAPGTDRDEPETEEQHPSRIDPLVDAHQGERPVAETVDDAQADDRQILSEEDVAEQRPEDRREIDRAREEVVVGGRLRTRHGLRADRSGQQKELRRHEDRQDPLHAVEAESLRGLVPDDVGDAAWHRLGRGGGGQIFRH